MRQAGSSALLWSALCAVCACPACDKKPAAHTGIAQMDANDARIAQAKKDAQARWPEFVAAFEAKDPQASFAVKAPFSSLSGKIEHMWVRAREVSESGVTGVLDSIPVSDFAIKQGDTVTVPIAEIEDWIVARGEANIIGAFSMPALREAEKERGGP